MPNIQHTPQKGIASRLLAGLVCCAMLAVGFAVSPAASEAAGASTELGYVNQMDSSSVMSIQLSITEENWQFLLDNPTDKEYVSADITINGTTVTNVGIRTKGNSSLSSVAGSDSDRYGFKIKFDEYVKGQTWLGLDKLVLNANFADATSMKEYLSYDIMRTIGVETPLFAYADISVNGETWGLYLAIEDMDSGYRDRVYDGEGELYKPDNDMGMGGGGRQPFTFEGTYGEELPELPDMPDMSAGEGPEAGANAGTTPGGMLQNGFPQGEPPAADEGATQEGWPGFGNRGGGERGDFGGMFSSNGVTLQYTDDEISSYSAIFDNEKTKTDEADHQRVATAIQNLNEGTDLETYVDVDATLRYFAAHTVVVNLDSYISSMAHNYILYENNGQLTMLPWDYNMAFGGFQSGSASDVVNFPIDTPVSGVSLEDRPMLSKLLEVEEYAEKYHQYLQEIIDAYFADGKFSAKIDSLNDLISGYVRNDPTAFYTYEEYQDALSNLKTLGELRAESIQGQLDGSIPSTIEGQQANPESLVDAASVNMTALGTHGGGMRQNMQRPEGGDASGGPMQNRPPTGAASGEEPKSAAE